MRRATSEKLPTSTTRTNIRSEVRSFNKGVRTPWDSVNPSGSVFIFCLQPPEQQVLQYTLIVQWSAENESMRCRPSAPQNLSKGAQHRQLARSLGSRRPHLGDHLRHLLGTGTRDAPIGADRAEAHK